MSGRRHGRRIIVLLLVINLVLAGVLFYAARQHLSAGAPQQETEMKPEQLRSISDGMQGVTYNPEPFMKDGKIAVMLSNGSQTGNSVRLELILLTDQTQLARTDLIDAGYRLEYLTAGKRLNRGEYSCLLRIELCTPQGEPIGTAGRSLLLKVE